MIGDVIEVAVDEVYLEKGDIVVTSLSRGAGIRLRRFQEELVRTLGAERSVRYIGLEAPTGGGKTFSVLAPFLSNVLYSTRYSGVVGVYPTKPLVNDQFISIRNTLDMLGERLDEIKVEVVESGEVKVVEVAIKYRLDVEVADKKVGTSGTVSATVGLVRLTRDVLDKLQEALKVAPGRLSLLDLIKKVFLDADYLIAVAVPEYPYLMLSSLYRSAPDAQKLLSLSTEGGYVYDLARKIAAATPEKAVELVRMLRHELAQLLHPKAVERERLNIYSALFSEVMFLDEFHTWTIYERPTVLALILLHHLESMRSAEPERHKVILSSATPQKEFYDLLRELGLGEIKEVKAAPASRADEADRVRSRAIVRFVPCYATPSSGAVAWFKVEDCIPEIVKRFAHEVKARERAIVFARRNAVVEEATEQFYAVTGEEPTVVTGVRTRFPGKEMLEQRKDSGKMFVFGNYSVELGVDLRKMPFGIIYGVYIGEVVQRLGRVGRGDVEQAEVVIPIPAGYAPSVAQFVERYGSRLTYESFIELLRNVMPERLGVEVYGAKFVMRHKLGKLRVYLSIATYMLTVIALWEYTEELRKLCRKFVEVMNALGVPSIFNWLRKVPKRAEVLVPIASFRIAPTVPYLRDGVEDYTSLSTLLGNYDVEYADGKLVVKGVSKKSLQSVLSLRCRFKPSGIEFDAITLSTDLIKAVSKAVVEEDRGTPLYRVLRDHPIPVYTAQPNEDYSILNAFGYALRIELVTGATFYLLIL